MYACTGPDKGNQICISNQLFWSRHFVLLKWCLNIPRGNKIMTKFICKCSLTHFWYSRAVELMIQIANKIEILEGLEKIEVTSLTILSSACQWCIWLDEFDGNPYNQGKNGYTVGEHKIALNEFGLFGPKIFPLSMLLVLASYSQLGFVCVFKLAALVIVCDHIFWRWMTRVFKCREDAYRRQSSWSDHSNFT